MKTVRKCFLFIFVLVLAMAPSGWARTSTPEAGEGVLVGRISHVEGQLLRYVPEEKDWVATVKDAPFGLEDSLYSEAAAKAEFIMPNNTWIRIGGSTQIQLITLRTDVTEVDIASGMARVYNRNSQGVIRATSPFGYVVAPANSVFDLYVGDRSLEVIALKGKVDFVLDRDQSRYEVVAGGSSVISDGQQVTSGQGQVDADWDDWNSQRDQLWSKRTEVRGESVRYLPPSLHDESYALEENGRWEQVYYEGQYRRFWRPTVAAGWAPFTAGRWTVYYGDNCWVPYEPFGYVTHHYGNWLYAGNFWYWAPPVVGVQVGIAPLLGIGFGWYPGRVGWISSGINVGWIPLAPFEPYYCNRYWGPRNLVVNNINVTNININRYQYANRAIVVNQRNLYGVNNYQNVRITNINRNTIINNYRAAPVVNNTVVKNYSDMRNRYNFTDARVEHRPHDTVLNRISHNEQVARTAGGVNARAIEQNVATFQQGKPQPEAKVEPPRVTDRLVRPQDAGRPTSDLQLPQREVRAKSKAPSPIVAGPGRESEHLQGRTGTEGQPVETNRGKAISKEGQTFRPSRPGQELQSTSPERSGAVGQEGQRVRPARPGATTTPAEQKPSVTLPRENQRVRPARPGQELQTTEPGQRKTSDEPGTNVVSPRPGNGSQAGEEGPVKSPLDNSRRVRQPKPQQERLLPGGGQQAGQTGPSGQAAEQGPRLRSSRPPTISQPDQTGQPGQPAENRQRARSFKTEQGTQGGQTERGALQPPSSRIQRTEPSGTGGEVRRPAARTVNPPAEGSRNAVIPRQLPQPQGSVAPVTPSQQPAVQQPRAHRQKEVTTPTPAVEPPAAAGTVAPQAPQVESGPRGGGHGQKAAPADGMQRGKGRGAGNE